MNQHARPLSPGPSVPEPTYAERARTLAHLGRTGALSTWSRKQPGFPFGSVMPYAPDDEGRPVFLISAMAMHTQNLAADSRASLLITQTGADTDPLGTARLTLIGHVAKVDGASVRELYLARHPNSSYWVDFDDFAFYRLDAIDLYYVGGFGVMGWVEADEYRAAAVDSLADAAPGIISHMNADHAEALLTLARAAGETGAEQAAMTAVDRLGFHLRLKAGERVYGIRLPFIRPLASAHEARAVFIEMLRNARG